MHLDTHVVVWLYAGELERISSRALEDLGNNELIVSPVVALEVQYLYEIERLTVKGETVIDGLKRSVGLEVSQRPFADVVGQALSYSWTRDPFDRLITAEAAVAGERLLTKDATIRAHYRRAYWP